MTVSTIQTLSLSLNEIVREAFDVIGVGSEGEAITSDMYRRGKNSLNLMILTWNADENLWRKEQLALAPVADQAAYVLDDPKPLRVTSARRKTLNGGYETPMTMWSRQEYLDMPNKLTSPSTPVNFYYDTQRDSGTLYLWPAPSTAVFPTISIIIDTLRPMFLMDSSADTLDMPAEWQQTVVYSLADLLMDKYPVNDPNVGAKITARAAALYARLKAFDNEIASIYLQPDDRWDGWRR